MRVLFKDFANEHFSNRSQYIIVVKMIHESDKLLYWKMWFTAQNPVVILLRHRTGTIYFTHIGGATRVMQIILLYFFYVPQKAV